MVTKYVSDEKSKFWLMVCILTVCYQTIKSLDMLRIDTFHQFEVTCVHQNRSLKAWHEYIISECLWKFKLHTRTKYRNISPNPFRTIGITISIIITGSILWNVVVNVVPNDIPSQSRRFAFNNPQKPTLLLSFVALSVFTATLVKYIWPLDVYNQTNDIIIIIVVVAIMLNILYSCSSYFSLYNFIAVQ